MIAVTLMAPGVAVPLVAPVVAVPLVSVVDIVRMLGAGLHRRPRHEEVQSGCRLAYAAS